MANNPNLEMVTVNAYANIDETPSIRSQDIERKRKFDSNQGQQTCCIVAKADA